MKRYLTFISLALILFSCSPRLVPDVSDPNPVIDEITTPVHFRTTVRFGENSVTGIMAFRQKGNLSVYGSFTNEFGVKGFDFIYRDGKTDLVYIMPALNRIMIKKILKKDISLLVRHGIGRLSLLQKPEIESSPKMLYPDLYNIGKKKNEVLISGGNNGVNTMLTLDDVKHKLTITLTSIKADE
jgi:hypothetical protein